MFKIVETRTFTHDVKIMLPVDGGFVEETLNTTFNYLPADELGPGFLEKAVVRFNNLVDDNEQPVTCTDELRAKILASPNVVHGLTDYYSRVIQKVAPGN
ncbi:hypothetical protein [Bradyrhizobium japonicum]|uniref:hypothetical protein n=1 Tax=Bradyrhizobium japonicum TaxID=375 RepID=UPI001BAD171D|nr:hypothetical protein [Bradyrhizobium japonicum]MBR0962254.1 hypothetical protein [Bradyrhizobium japonicum]